MARNEDGTSGQYKQAMTKADYLVPLIVALLLTMSLLFVALTPIVYDTVHLADTLFLASVAWRIYSGATPVIDFGHFYGGVSEQYIAWSFSIFGLSIKALDHALVLQFCTVAALIAAAAWRRISGISFWLLILLAGTLILTRIPLELETAPTRVWAAHSFIYNRLGLALAIPVMVFVLLPVQVFRTELLIALIVGIVVYLIALTKPSFFVFAPGVFMALLVQGRLLVLLACGIGVLVAFLLLDPGAARLSGAFDYIMNSVSEQIQRTDLVRKGVQLLLAQPIALAGVVSAGLIMLVKFGWQAVPGLIGGAMVMGGGVGMTVTMGAEGTIGQQALPLLAALAIVLFEMTLRFGGGDAVGLLKMIAIVITAGFALPHIANIAASSVEAIASHERLLIKEGPLANYISRSEDFDLPYPGDDPLAAVQAASEKLEAGHPLESGIQYPMLADGIAVLREIKGIEGLGIVADGGLSFDFAMGAPPVLGFPVWLRETSPELAAGRPLPKEADIVMLRRFNSETFIRSRLNDDFVLCRRTPIWEVFRRNSKSLFGCEGMGPMSLE